MEFISKLADRQLFGFKGKLVEPWLFSEEGGGVEVEVASEVDDGCNACEILGSVFSCTLPNIEVLNEI